MQMSAESTIGDSLLSVHKMWASESCEPRVQSIEESLKKKNATKIENSNTENINWTLTVVNKCLTLNSA